MRLTRTGVAFLMSAMIVALLPIALHSPYVRATMVVCGLYALLALSLDLMVGFLGMYSFGHAAFFGAGAYTVGILTESCGWTLWTALPAAMAVAFILGIFVSFPALRMRGVYFAITTLAAAEILRMVVANWPALTRGVMGLSVSQPDLSLFGDDPDQTVFFYYAVYAALIATCFFMRRFIHSASGRSLIAIRENEQLAGAIGIKIFRVKATVFGVSAMLAGLAGALYAPFVGILTPELLGVNYSALALLMVVVGGKSTIIGAVIGAFMFTVLTEVFRVANEMRMVAFAAVLILSIIFLPRGVAAPLIAGFDRVVDALAGMRRRKTCGFPLADNGAPMRSRPPADVNPEEIPPA